MRWWRIFGLAGWLIVRVQTKSEPQARLACIPKKAIVIAKGLFVGWRELVYLKKRSRHCEECSDAAILLKNSAFKAI